MSQSVDSGALAECWRRIHALTDYDEYREGAWAALRIVQEVATRVAEGDA